MKKIKTKMPMYKQINDDTLILSQQAIYGSSRLGVLERDEIVSIDSTIHTQTPTIPDPLTEHVTHWTRGHKRYELTNHLGNVLATVSDRKLPVYQNGAFNYYKAEVMTANDYYAFGMVEPKRGFDTSDYRFGYNTQLKDDEIYGKNNAYSAPFWEYDPRVVKRWNVDPKTVTWESPYAINRGNPIIYNDPNGDVGNLVVVNNANGGGTVFVVATYYTVKGDVSKNGFNAMQMADIKNIETSLNSQNHKVTEDISYKGQNLNGYSVQFVLNIKEVDAEIDVRSSTSTQTISAPNAKGSQALSPNNSLMNYSPDEFVNLDGVKEAAKGHGGKVGKIGGITSKDELAIAKQDGVIANESAGATFSSNILHEMFHTWGVDKDNASVKENSIGTGNPVPNSDDINQTVKALIKSEKVYNGTGKPEKK